MSSFRAEPATVESLMNRFSSEAVKGKERGVDWLQGDFLKYILLSPTPSFIRDIAAINVTDVTLIEEFVFSAAFSTFDQA